MKRYRMQARGQSATIYRGDCVKVLPTLESGSFDAVICDPPYPCIDRSYGRWTEAEWFDLMRVVVPECMRVLKPKGSAVFILQPNSERLGRMRTWLWEFMAWVGREWGIVQDAYWWNFAAMPEAHAIQGRLMRPSVKTCVWVGPSDCLRDQDAVLWTESDGNKMHRIAGRAQPSVMNGGKGPSGHHSAGLAFRDAAAKRGGVTPFNLIPIAAAGRWGAGAYGHGAGTPLALCEWWTRYITPPGGSVLDPFAGSGTTGVAALNLGSSWVGIEKETDYVDICKKRVGEAVRKVKFRRATLL